MDYGQLRRPAMIFLCSFLFCPIASRSFGVYLGDKEKEIDDG